MCKIGSLKSKKIQIVRHVADLRRLVSDWRQEQFTIGLVPTMGAIHSGHQSLVTAVKSRCDKVIASIFVNPAQFGENEDLADYPVDEKQDVISLTAAGTDIIFSPSSTEVYPKGFTTAVTVSRLAAGLCGPFRPGHFEGVATVVTKLLLQALPDIAIFGEKDYQQLLVIRQLVKDLNIPVTIIGAPIIRENDGLAMSTRNQYLSPYERQIAAELYLILKLVVERVKERPSECESICRLARTKLLEKGFEAVDYITICDNKTLNPLSTFKGNARVLGAARLGNARLIDNIPIL
tara:strand:+ start:1924 stop:2799 length:876 start_codon:yes stop_codon:yes gene_type:complete